MLIYTNIHRRHELSDQLSRITISCTEFVRFEIWFQTLPICSIWHYRPARFTALILREETTLGHLSSWRTVVLVADDAASTNLDEAIDWGINETQEHDS
jgi:hypothetical protein